MRLKLSFFCLLFLIACSPEFLKLASQYQNNILSLDKLQKEFRKELSHCDYDKQCFDENIKDYIEKQVCVSPDYESYGFVSVRECEKACFTLADQVKNFQNFGEVSCKNELAKTYDLEEKLDEAKEDLDEADRDYTKADKIDKDEEKEAWEDLQEAKEDFNDTQRDYNKSVREYNKCISGIE